MATNDERDFRSLIDRHLGVSFPDERRVALVFVWREARAEMKAAIGRYVRRETSPNEHAATLNAIHRRTIKAFGRLLSPEEKTAFLGSNSDADLVNPDILARNA